MVSSDEINRRLEARRRGVKYQDPQGRRTSRDVEISSSKECPSCQTQNPSTAKFCVGCGKKLETTEPEPEKEFSPEIKGPEEPVIEKPIQKKHTITQRPDDFSKPEKLKPIVTNNPEPVTTPEPEPDPAPEPSAETTPEPSAAEQEPPQIKRPETIPSSQSMMEKPIPPESQKSTEPESRGKEKPEVDPVERIKKAKELLDIGAITQEEFDIIKKKYLDEI
ncbi:MAG TPA: hypothetical protein VMC48_00880 [Methanobacterium sp.]|nr:hypothetical protein [Methanobacterium sp.]